MKMLKDSPFSKVLQSAQVNTLTLILYHHDIWCMFFFFFFWVMDLDRFLMVWHTISNWVYFKLMICHKISVLVSIQVRITHASLWGSLVLINVVWVRAFQDFEDEWVGLFRIKRNYFFEFKIQCVKTWNAFFAFAHFHISHLDDKLVLVHI